MSSSACRFRTVFIMSSFYRVCVCVCVCVCVFRVWRRKLKSYRRPSVHPLAPMRQSAGWCLRGVCVCVFLMRTLLPQTFKPSWSYYFCSFSILLQNAVWKWKWNNCCGLKLDYDIIYSPAPLELKPRLNRPDKDQDIDLNLTFDVPTPEQAVHKPSHSHSPAKKMRLDPTGCVWTPHPPITSTLHTALKHVCYFILDTSQTDVSLLPDC